MTKVLWAEGRASCTEDGEPRLSLNLSWREKTAVKLQKALCARKVMSKSLSFVKDFGQPREGGYG